MPVICRCLPAVLAIALLAACGEEPSQARIVAPDDAQTATLPSPEGGRARDSVTGMPNTPGPGTLPAIPGEERPGDLPPDTPVARDGSIGPLPAPPGTDADGGAVMPGSAGDIEIAPVPTGEPTPQDAIAVLRRYYAAIDAGDYARAHALWANGGRASGQSLQQFAHGFADTRAVAVEFETPSRVEAAAGSRYIEIPVAIRANHDDDSVHRYLGIYTLRRAVVDGASAEQRAWRIMSADIRQVEP